MTPQRLLTYILIAGFVAAPAIGLLYGIVPGLVILACALVATLFLIGWAEPQVPDDLAPRLRLLKLLNGVMLILTLGCLIVAIVR